MITAVIGAQYGSEGKGKVIQHLAHEYDIFVRVGGPNAGHVIYFDGFNGEFKDSPVRMVMRSVPCGWINPNSKLIIGAGAVISIEVLMNELKQLEKYDPIIKQRLYIDKNAMVITDEHSQSETQLKDRIGSTGEGVGAARVDRLLRIGKLASDYKKLQPFLCDTREMLYNSRGFNILLEGTQGSELSLIHAEYPYCTSADTNVSQLLSDVGLPPIALDNTILVVRSMPIRVGGNSGPLQHEVTFDQLNTRIGKKIEHTSVTKKVRRVGMLDMNKLIKASQINAPTHIAFMFADYVDIKNENATTLDELTPHTRRLISTIGDAMGAEVMFISTGIHTMIKL